MPFDHRLAQRIRERLESLKTPEVEEKSMMGGLVFMVDGKMCLCALDDSMLCRLDPDDVTVSLARPGCSPMAFTGRVMKGFLVVGPEGMRTRAEFESWIARALEYNPRAKSSKRERRPKGFRIAAAAREGD